MVCTANLYRSPLAEHLLRHRLGQAGAAGVHVASAGSLARPGDRLPAATAQRLAEADGAGFAERFVPRRLTPALVAGADLVLGLAQEHREAAVRLHPVALRRCFTLLEFVRLSEQDEPHGSAGPGGTAAAGREAVARAAARRGLGPPATAEADSVADPAGGPPEELLHCAALIEAAVDRLAAVLCPPR
ncbi:low molecular weight phosphatase family protein [Kitasatospora arboriphila]|uniref:Phosphotyrosine protein phosphatase I domain-containing protein n=1 Tax=Kitasatospora arboriphila TaxID=258052 RepID=A0ABP4EHY3_9ACTN